MPTIVILDNEDATIWFHTDTKIVHHYLKHFTHGARWREILEKGAATLELYKATKWLSDDRNNSALSPDDEKWGNDVWFPRVRRAGWKHWAIVQPEKAVGQLNMKRIKDTNAKQGINVRMFSDPEEAEKWLVSL